MSVLRTVGVSALVGSVLALPLPAFAADGGAPAKPGKAKAVTAELGLNVELLNTVKVPVEVSLNKVESPAQRDGAVLTATVDGVDGGRPVNLVKAQVGKSVTKVDDKQATASVQLVGAAVHAPACR
ncbi:hypothetical protein [Kitasatospora cheerisanensis]|uniref:hypothetical protein n=1 Tax=Kitasatospora cheerisanensis TaxID=81942 RepID=UPI00068A11B7|nr:hypothetical protein [Kitasatospora cheerisanensis]